MDHLVVSPDLPAESGVERLFDLSASVGVNLQPERDLDDDGCLPLHGRFLVCARIRVD
jgi:hypothetical protein